MEVVDTMKWANLADAYATVAKIQKDETAMRLSKAIKLHAYRRMGEIAQELRPMKHKGNYGATKGPHSALREAGLGRNEATAAVVLGRTPREKFDEIASRPNPPSPLVFMMKENRAGSDAYKNLVCNGFGLQSFRSFTRKYHAPALARQLSASEAEKVKSMFVGCVEWLDALEQALPK